MNPPYKTTISIPLPTAWLVERAFLQDMVLYVGPGMTEDQARKANNRYIDQRWAVDYFSDWLDLMEETFLVAKIDLLQQGRDLHLLNYYDNTDPLKDHSGSVTYTFSDRDTALMFKLAYTRD